MITTNERQERLIDAYAELINPSKARQLRASGIGIIEERKSGAYVWDQDGTRYIDCRDEFSLYNVGRKNSEISTALIEALKDFDLGTPRFLSEPRIHLARRLGKLSPRGLLTGVAYGANGQEVNTFAIKLARVVTGRKKVISIQGSSHEFDVQVPYGDLNALRDSLDTSTACVILEPIQNGLGAKAPPRGYLREVRKMCDDANALLIVDELITGLGRTGTLFAIEIEEVVPDVLTLGNSLGGGLFPITAALFRSSYLALWMKHSLAPCSPFGGSDLGCLVGLETLNLIQKQDLAQRAFEMGAKFERGFAKLKKRYPRVLKSFNHAGLLMAAEFTSPALGPQMSRDLSQFGVLAAHCVEKPERMLLTPTLTLTDNDLDVVLDAFDRALAGCHSIVVPMDPDVLLGLIRSIQGS